MRSCLIPIMIQELDFCNYIALTSKDEIRRWRALLVHYSHQSQSKHLLREVLPVYCQANWIGILLENSSLCGILFVADAANTITLFIYKFDYFFISYMENPTLNTTFVLTLEDKNLFKTYLLSHSANYSHWISFQTSL